MPLIGTFGAGAAKGFGLTSAIKNPFLVATGGTITEDGDYKIHTFTGPGTFTVCQVSETAAENTVSYLIVAGGGGTSTTGGPGDGSGGAGAGGFREGRNNPVDPYTASPKVADAPTNAITVTATSFPITVGGGGPPYVCGPGGGTGANSVFSTITSNGGGQGGQVSFPNVGPQLLGGSGGGHGGTGTPPQVGSGGSGNQPIPTSPSQGNNGGSGRGPTGGGGGGAVNGGSGGSAGSAGPGGAGASTSITGSSVAYAGDGGGATRPPCGGSGGNGGTGGGGPSVTPSTPAPVSGKGTAGTANTGGGAGAPGAQGGSGIVVIRYKFQ